MAAAASARSEDIKRLQQQVDQMKERLDFVSPVLPLVNFVRDFVEKVECEASLQLMRLRKAQVHGRTRDGEEGVSNAQLETVKFIHFVTDAVIALHVDAALQHAGGGGGPSPREQPSAAPARPQAGEASLAHEPRQLPIFSEGGGSVSRRPSAGGLQPPVGPRQPQPPPTQDAALLNQRPESSRGNFEQERPGPGGYLLRPPGSPSSSTAGLLQRGIADVVRQPSSSSTSATGPRDPYRGVRQHRESPSGTPKLPADPVTEPTAGAATALEPGTGGTAGATAEDRPGETEGPNGLVLGKGSWAAAYRQAQGGRRASLQLLCTSGIVTARELSDDLTVISEEHIEECVVIAGEMLQTWPLDMWAKQPMEAKKFFEARLTELYQRKFGEQKP